MSFIWPNLLAALLLVPLFIVYYLRMLKRRQRAAAELGPMGIVQDGSGRVIRMRRHMPPLFQLLGLTLLLFSLARPEMVVGLPRVEGTVILAFDVSNSMSAADLEPTRIEAAKSAARVFVEKQPPTIKIGVVAFGSAGLVVQKPTDDQAVILATIDRLSPQGGTSLGRGIFTSLNAIAGESLTIEDIALEEETQKLRIEDYSSAVVVLLTDGENTQAPDPLGMAQLAAEAGVRIFPVGIGSQEGAVLEIDGFYVLTQLNEATLKQIASSTNGVYYRAEDEGSLQEIYQNIDLQLTISGEEMEVTSILAGLSMLLLLVGGGLSLFWFGRVP
jgi:Ca-activated chloride channel family protein